MKLLIMICNKEVVGSFISEDIDILRDKIYSRIESLKSECSQFSFKVHHNIAGATVNIANVEYWDFILTTPLEIS